MLSDLGRREEALQAADEAVGVYRQLAAQRPEAFSSDLARSLGAKGAVLLKSGDAVAGRNRIPRGCGVPEAAVPSLAEGIPAVDEQPWSEIISALAKRPGRTSDMDLLHDILPRLSDDEADAAEA